jgi:hypothetical protein
MSPIWHTRGFRDRADYGPGDQLFVPWRSTNKIGRQTNYAASARNAMIAPTAELAVWLFS